jgi:hypothetical protein
MGMSMRDVINIMGRQPDYEYSYKSCMVAYFVAPPDRWGHKAAVKDYKPKSSVRRLSDLPDLYDSMQMAFNSNRVLIAYSRIGESYTIEMANRRPVKGSQFAEIEKAGRDLE